jgi:hypothetical protein
MKQRRKCRKGAVEFEFGAEKEMYIGGMNK